MENIPRLFLHVYTRVKPVPLPLSPIAPPRARGISTFAKWRRRKIFTKMSSEREKGRGEQGGNGFPPVALIEENPRSGATRASEFKIFTVENLIVTNKIF